jgi:hypothetical protein
VSCGIRSYMQHPVIEIISGQRLYTARALTNSVGSPEGSTTPLRHTILHRDSTHRQCRLWYGMPMNTMVLTAIVGSPKGEQHLYVILHDIAALWDDIPMNTMVLTTGVGCLYDHSMNTMVPV